VARLALDIDLHRRVPDDLYRVAVAGEARSAMTSLLRHQPTLPLPLAQTSRLGR